jgi:hypothetical protein
MWSRNVTWAQRRNVGGQNEDRVWERRVWLVSYVCVGPRRRSMSQGGGIILTCIGQRGRIVRQDGKGWRKNLSTDMSTSRMVLDDHEQWLTWVMDRASVTYNYQQRDSDTIIQKLDIIIISMANVSPTTSHLYWEWARESHYVLLHRTAQHLPTYENIVTMGPKLALGMYTLVIFVYAISALCTCMFRFTIVVGPGVTL